MAYGGAIAAAIGRAEEDAWPTTAWEPSTFPAPFAHAPTLERDCPEIDCLRDLLPPGLIRAAERRASEIGLGADRVLIAADAITEDAYLAAFAAWHGVTYERLDLVSRHACPLEDERLIQAEATGLLPLYKRDAMVWVVAPRSLAARRLAVLLELRPELSRFLHITSSEQIRRFVAPHIQRALGRRAADGLRLAWPLLSSGPRTQYRRAMAAAVCVCIALALIAASPRYAMSVVGAAMSIVFLMSAALRLASALLTHRAPRRPWRVGDDQLPIYTIICALYREAAVVEALVASIRRFDYPREKLDVKLVLEPDDDETWRALARLDLGPPFEIVTAPSFGPRTKPKALNAALPFARGTFTVIYDAEDRPEPDQLRAAFDTFMAGDDRLACVQAQLTIDNTADGWLARMLTAEYAGQFDVFLPGLAAMRLPLPLGGSSNHFRTAVLREIGGWDAYNVTEDADLGMRLSRFGYRSTVVSSTTYEEAPAQVGPWLRQRTRWFKGWMQTWLVHVRRPRVLLRELGPAGATTFQLVIGGAMLTALANPIFVAGLCYLLATQSDIFDLPDVSIGTLLFGTTFVAGYLVSVVLGVIGLSRRRLLRSAWVLALVPVHWLLLSLAAWRAFFQLVRDPYGWEKTEHGLAKTSRMVAPE